MSRYLCILALALSPSWALAALVQQIAADATVHRVEVDGGIRHTLVRDGASTVSLVPGTDDANLDLEPTLEIDPATDAPVVVWSRDDGTGFDVWISRYQADAWSTPQRILGQPGADEVAPRIQIAGESVHVVAREGSSYVRLTLDRVSLQPTFGPEPLPTDGSAIVPGPESAGATEPVSGNVYFASDVVRDEPEDPGEVVIWGVRDEPVPIDYLQGLVLPAEIDDAGAPLATRVEGSLAVLVPTATRVWYTFWLQGAWAEFRAVNIDESTSMSDVRLMVADVIRRQSD
jgi:hypothetical protein